MRVLGIDPGLRLTGYGCIECGVEGVGGVTLVEAGVFRLTRPGAPATGEPGDDCGSVSERLFELDRDIRALLGRLAPDVVAVESLFAHYKHPATAIIMGHARGVILLAIRSAGRELVELRPNAVKKSLTGRGHADKMVMQRAIQARFELERPPQPPDVADALAIALCAAVRKESATPEPRPSRARAGRLTSRDVERMVGRSG